MNGNSDNSVGQPSLAMQDETQGEQQPLQAPAQGSQYPNGGDTANVAPAAPQPERWANIPAALRERPQWVLAGADKRPLTADGRAASSTDPATWCDFDTASRAAQAKDLHIGYMLHEGDPFTCIDLDVKDTTPQEHVERFNRIVTAFDSYTERSRSGKGFHVWVEGRVGKGRKRDGVEVYSQERFIICTGDTVSAKPIAARPDLLSTLVAEMQGPAPAPDVELDGELVPDFGLATRAALGDGELGRLFNGDWEGRYPSQSEADLALVKLLLPLTESNGECWQTFCMSALGKRDKAKRWDYAGRTLAQAAQHLANDAAQAAHGKTLADSLFWRPTTAGTLTAKPLGVFLRESEAIEFVIDDVYRRGWLYTITGSTGSGKTGIAVSVALCVASGVSVGKHPTQAGPVLYIAGENPDDVRGRFLATLQRGEWADDVLDKVHVIDQSFLLAERIDDMEAIIDTLNPVMIVVDTDQAVSLSGAESENDNGVRMKHAKTLRRLVRRPCRPTVLDLCHPNGAATKDNLVPRGGSSFLNEIDGNTRCWRDDTVTTLSSDPNKFRGTAFELGFRKEEVTLDELRDTKGRHIAMPVFIPADDQTLVMEHASQYTDRQRLLKVMHMYPHMNQLGWLDQLEWKTPSGEPNKPKISRMLKALRECDPPLVGPNNGLTKEGQKQAKSVYGP